MLIPLGEFFTTYGFRTTFIAASLVGLLAGAFGSLLYLRKASLLSDVMGHSALSGVGIAFVLTTVLFGGNGRSIIVLTIGASIASFVAIYLSHWITNKTPLGADSSMAVVMAIFYGGGLCIIHMVSFSHLPNRSGLSEYIFGNAATTRGADLTVISWIAVGLFAILILLWKEFKIGIFDPVSAQVYGFSPRIINSVMMACITIAIVAGIKSVGLILMVAFAILPAAICYQFATSMLQMVCGSALVGALAGGCGAYISINFGSVPTGPVVVILLFIGFLFSALLSPKARSWNADTVQALPSAKESAAPGAEVQK